MSRVNRFLFHLSWILVFGLKITVLFSEDDRQHVAVFDFEAKGISRPEAELLTDRFRGEIVNTNAFIVIERSIMDQILEEHNLQMTGSTETSDAVRAGKLLNVHKVVTGSIGKIGSTHTVNIKLIDVESAQIQRFFNRDHQGEIECLLPILKEIASEVAGKSDDQSEKMEEAEPQDDTGVDIINF